MAFYDRFVEAWRDWNPRWGAARENLNASWESLREFYKLQAAMAGNLWNTAFGDGDEKDAAEAFWASRSYMDRSFDSAGLLGASVGGIFGAVGEMPVGRQILTTIDEAQRQLVSRPIATWSLVHGDLVNNRQHTFDSDGEMWRNAYNSTTYVTPGQAIVYAASSYLQGLHQIISGDELTAMRRRDIIRQYPTLGVLFQDPKSFDPRAREEGRNAYYENTFMRGLSGTLDAGIVLFLDPTILLGKGAAAAKLRYVSRPMNAAAISSGRFDRFMAGTGVNRRGYQRFKEYVRNAKNSEQVFRRVFANHTQGDMAAALLFDAAKMQPTYEAMGGKIDLFDTTFRALYGDVDAWNTLAAEAAPYAQIIGQRRANYTIATAAQNYGTGDPAATAHIQDLMETKVQAWADATTAGYGMWGKLRDQPVLAGQNLPRLTWTSKWRVGAHSLLRNETTVILGHWARRSAYLLPSMRRGRMLDLNDPNSSHVFRANLEISRLSQTEVDRWAGAYARATSAEARFEIYSAAENYLLAKHSSAYGLRPKDVENLIPMMNRFRQGNRQILAGNRRFASEDVVKSYEKRLRLMAAPGNQRIQLSQSLIAAKHAVEAQFKAGQFPSHYYSLPNEFGDLVLVPEDMNLRLDSPVLSSQHADMVPMVDWNVLENALWWHVGFGRGKPSTKRNPRKEVEVSTLGAYGYAVQDLSRAFLEAVMSVWNVTAILRPGYIWRALSDEMARIAAAQMHYPSLATMGGSAKHTAQNMWSRGKLLGDVISGRVARQKAYAVQARRGRRPVVGPRQGGAIEIEGDVVALGLPTDPNPANRLGAGAQFDPTLLPYTDAGHKIYASYEHALADGVIDSESFLSAFEGQGRAGTLPPQLAQAYDAWRQGRLSGKKMRRQVIDYSLRQVPGRSSYANVAWQQNFIDEVRNSYKVKQPGKPGVALLIDPLTGVSPKVTPEQIRGSFTVVQSKRIDPDSNGNIDVDDVYDFIADNLDQLTRPDQLLHAYSGPAGELYIGVAQVLDQQIRLKPTGGTRVRLPRVLGKGDLYRDSGTADIRIKTRAGDIYLRGAFVGGSGDRFRHQVSSRGPEDAFVDAVVDTEWARFIANAQRHVDVGPDDWQNYANSWERAVNLQLGNDPVARKFIMGDSYDDVIDWLHNTNEGRAYQFKMGPWRSVYAEHVAMIQSMVEEYVPVGNAVPNKSKRFRKQQPPGLIRRILATNHPAAVLRSKILDGEATISDLEAVVRRDEMPRVHGPSIEAVTLRGPFISKIKRVTDSTFKMLADLPADKLVRFPFAAERYKYHATQIAQARGAFAEKAGHQFSIEQLEGIERVARTRALRDVQRYLFNANATWDLAKSMRLFVPFGSALADSALKWGLVLRENPHSFVTIWRLWSAPERAGLVVDQDGNQLEIEDGKERWYSVNPATGERTLLEGHQAKDRYITFRLPSFLSDRYYKGETAPVVRINKRIFQTFLDMPTAGPIVALPASEFALDHPEFAENKFVKQFILPFGPSADRSAMIVPANVRNIRRTFLPNWLEQDRNVAQSQAVAIYAAEMTNYSLNLRPEPPTFDEAREKAGAMRGIRFLATFAGFSSQVQSPYQPYVDYYHQLQLHENRLREEAVAAGRNPGEAPSADEMFYRQMGDEFFALTMSVTRNTAGVPATIEANNAFKKYRDLVEQHPDLGPLIIGAEGAGEFSRAVYEAQKAQPMRPGGRSMQREILSMEDSWEDMERRRGWVEYGRFMDLVHLEMEQMGLTSLADPAGRRLRDARDSFIQSRAVIDSPWGGTVISPWYIDFHSVDRSRIEQRLHSMRQIVQDSRLQGRDDIRGLIDYLYWRDRFKLQMQNSGYATLSSEEALPLKREWDRVVFMLKSENLSFAALHDRWLTADEWLEAD